MKKELALKNSIFSLVSRVVITAMSLVCTYFFVKELGVEVRGINGMLTNCFNFMNLAEMGLCNAVMFALYQPIIDNDRRQISQLMKFYHKLYTWVGFAIVGIGIVISFFLRFIIVDATRSWSFIMTAYYLLLINTAFTFFFAYKRNLLYTDQKTYVVANIESVANIIVSVLKVLAVVVMKSYFLYLLLQLGYTIISNAIINIWVNKYYPYVSKQYVWSEDEIQGETKIQETAIIKNMGNIMTARIGKVVYNSTDNILITRFVGVLAAGYMSFYYEVVKGFRLLVRSIGSPVSHSFGLHIREDKDVRNVLQLYLNYTFIQFCFANVVVVGFTVMINPLVELLFDKSYVMPLVVPVLMGVDLFIEMVHYPAVDFINVLGLFKDDRNQSLLGAAINLSVSIIAVNLIGVPGVLAGTVVTQVYHWVVRGGAVFRRYFKLSPNRYIFSIISYVGITGIDILILEIIKKKMIVEISYISFVGLCLASVVISLVSIVLYARTKEFRYMLSFADKYLKK